MRGLRGASLAKFLPVTFLFILHESPRPNGSVVTERKFRKRKLIPSCTPLCGTRKSGPDGWRFDRRSMTAASFVLCLAPVNTAKWISRSLLGLACLAQLHGESARVVTPPAGKLCHGFYWGGVGTDEHDPTEHDVTP